MLTTLLPFVLLFLILLAGLWLARNREGKRLRQLRDRLHLIEQSETREERPSLKLLRDDLLSEIPMLHRWLSQRRLGARLRTWLQQAGMTMRPGKYLLLTAGAAVVGGLLARLVLPGWDFLVGVGVGIWLPYAMVAHRRTRRLAQFTAQFPSAIDLLVRASRAGHPPNASFELIANEMPEPIAGEFRQVFEQQRFGLPLRDCLLNLAQRVPVVDVQFFVITVIVQSESGGNLAEILEKLAGIIRERFQLQRQVKIHTAQGRMTLWVLMGLAPLLLVVMLGLSHDFVMPLLTDPLGRMMLAVGVVLQLIGLYWLKKIIAFEV